MTTLALADGRSLDVRVTGPDGAPTLVYIHGTPSSARPPEALVEAAAARGLRTVSWSRPGYFTSSRQIGRSVADFAADAAAVLDHLGIETAYAAGWSGGGPHVLACAALLPERFTALASLAGVAPYSETQGALDWFDGMGQDNLDEFDSARKGEHAIRAFLLPSLPTYQVIEADEIVQAMESLLPEVDRAFCTGGLGEGLAESFREAVQVGVDGWIDDDLAFVEPWGFDLSTIGVPVAVWQGSEDLMVPFAHGRWLTDAIPGARAHLLQGEGHLSVVVGQAQSIVDDLLDLGSG